MRQFCMHCRVFMSNMRYYNNILAIVTVLLYKFVVWSCGAACRRFFLLCCIRKVQSEVVTSKVSFYQNRYKVATF